MIDPSFTFFWGNNSYRASQFAICLDGPIDPATIQSDIQNNPQLHCLFLHEYIHFLQDVSTRYGVMKAANLYSYTSQIAHCIRVNPNHNFLVPQSISEGKNVDNVILFNSKTWKHYLGSSFEIRKFYEGKQLEVCKSNYYTVDINGKTIEQIELTIKEKFGGKIGKIQFGGEIMAESMAFIAEQLYADNQGIAQLPVHDYPYRITELFVKLLYPELADRRDIVYLCIDACLFYTFNPGAAFFHLVNKLKSIEFHVNWNENHISDILEQLFQINIPFDNCINETMRLVRHDIQTPVLYATVKWLEKIYERSCFLRSNPKFMKCFIGNSIEDNRFSKIVIDILGIPPLHNDIYETSMTLPMNMLNIREAFDVHPEYYTAIASMLSVFNGNQSCTMKNFCKASMSKNNNIVVNQTCDKPWSKLQEQLNSNRKLCPFAFLWNYWGLYSKEPI